MTLLSRLLGDLIWGNNWCPWCDRRVARGNHGACDAMEAMMRMQWPPYESVEADDAVARPLTDDSQADPAR